VHSDLEPTADRRRIDVRVVTPDDAGLLKRTDATKTRRRREPNMLREFDVGQPPVGLGGRRVRDLWHHWQIMP
jgi:hypothetical protein